ncbi:MULTISPECIES: hypothetical protein [Amycolatopsis]|uniref:Uncharacterized protein n=1 Tax=Amycolatopsis echigonensis TaxID=2576905 RepID=A0A2N3WUZ5_9PSEU|nr:hypothetical protein [Amycolatopsis niigatensis]PKV97687.1 hypothetical protein ATK30_8682 [Amycolatopsis niigatensis]
MSEDMVHIEAEHQWLKGVRTSLCGLVFGPGQHERVWFFAWGVPRCKDCERIDERGF